MPPRLVRKVKTLVGLLRPQVGASSENEFWQGKAQENPLFNIATSLKDWTTEDFLRDGAWRVAKWVTPWLYKSGLDLARARFLEIGCGAGRFAGRSRRGAWGRPTSPGRTGPVVRWW